MTTTSTSRRRNARPDTCRVCNAAVPADAGWLYRHTNGASARSRYRRTGCWGWFVKCDGCHRNGDTKATHGMRQAAEVRAAAVAAGTVVAEPPSWSVRSVATWTLEWGTETGCRLLSATPVGPARISCALDRGEGAEGGRFENRYLRRELSVPVTGPGWDRPDVVLWVVRPAGGGVEAATYRDPITWALYGLDEWRLRQTYKLFGRHLSPAAAKALESRIRAAVAEHPESKAGPAGPGSATTFPGVV